MTVDLSILPWPVAAVAGDGQTRECNALWRARFGSCNQLAADFPEAFEKLRATVERGAATGDSAEQAKFLVRAPGEIAPLQLSFAALPDSLWLMIVETRERATDLPVAWVNNGAMRDAELAMDGVAMRLQARNWRAFFHDATAGKALIGLHGETLEVNRALCQLLDRSEHELLNLCARELRHPDDRDSVEVRYQSLLQSGAPIGGIEARYLHSNGHYVTYLLAISLIRDSRQRPLYFAAEIENISSRRQAEVELRQRTQELERANIELTRSNAELERFAFVASHDLQEPLRKIRVFGDRLATLAQQAPPNAPLSADFVHYIDVMTRSAQRMQNLVDGLLAYGRLEQRDTPFVPVDLNALWDELREEFETTLRESGAQLDVGDLPVVRGNPSRLRQLFGNLLSNALKFRGEAPPLIEVRARGAEGASTLAAIEVKDNGIGFDPAHAESIFEIFSRLHGRALYPGTGIGLSICRRVAREHGGDVRAFAQPSHGARFLVTLEK